MSDTKTEVEYYKNAQEPNFLTLLSDFVVLTS